MTRIYCLVCLLLVSCGSGTVQKTTPEYRSAQIQSFKVERDQAYRQYESRLMALQGTAQNAYEVATSELDSDSVIVKYIAGKIQSSYRKTLESALRVSKCNHSIEVFQGQWGSFDNAVFFNAYLAESRKTNFSAMAGRMTASNLENDVLDMLVECRLNSDLSPSAFFGAKFASFLTMYTDQDPQ